MLHGCCQTQEMFASLTKVYLDILAKKEPSLRVVHIEGQFDHSRTGKTWFRTELDLALIGTDHIPECDISETLDHVESSIRLNQVNVLIGFSQGGNVIDTYLRLRNGDGHIKAAVVFNGYSFPRYHEIVPHVGNMVYVTSNTDDIVRPEMLHDNYLLKVHLAHTKGHKIFTNKSYTRALIDSLLVYKLNIGEDSNVSV